VSALIVHPSDDDTKAEAFDSELETMMGERYGQGYVQYVEHTPQLVERAQKYTHAHTHTHTHTHIHTHTHTHMCTCIHTHTHTHIHTHTHKRGTNTTRGRVQNKRLCRNLRVGTFTGLAAQRVCKQAILRSCPKWRCATCDLRASEHEHDQLASDCLDYRLSYWYRTHHTTLQPVVCS